MFQDDETLRVAIEVGRVLGASSAREATVIALHRITDDEWSKPGARWEKAWQAARDRTR